MIGAMSALLLLAAAPAPAADPESIDRREFTCPVGGKAFSQDVGYPTYPLVTFPDGSYPGDDLIDVQIPVCPDNGLVILPDYVAMQEPGTSSMIYSAYSAAELAQLPGLIADPAYRALAPDGRHVQAHWLATRLGRPALTRFVLLQRATWAATGPALRRRLVERLVEEGPALIEAADMPDPARRMFRFYIVNGLRELGRFDEALALIETIERQGPQVPAPVGPDDMYGPGEYASEMRAVIAAKDMDRFPIALMPPKWANGICSGDDPRPPYGPLSATSRAACARRQAEAARKHAEDEASFEEMAVLMEDRAALDRKCAATPEAQRRGGLALACESVQRDRDTAAGDALTRDGPALAAACEATPHDRQKGALFYGCIRYETRLESALESALADDAAAYAILCPDDVGLDSPDRASLVSLACAGAERHRRDREVDLLAADPAIDSKCAAMADREEEYTTLSSACLQRADDLEQAERVRLARDDRAFGAKCGRFRRELAKPEDFGLEGTSDELRECRVLQRLREPPATPVFDDGDGEDSSLSVEARARAAAIIARAKAEGTYPKRRPGDRR